MVCSKYIKILMLFLFVILTSVCFSRNSYTQYQLSYDAKNILSYLTLKYSNQKNIPTGDLVIKIALEFLDRPYFPNTLEVNKYERLIVNLNQFDCTTLAENCLAMSRYIKKGEYSNNLRSFIKELTFIRYRNGKIKGYTSRLHYFSDWIYQNQEKNVVQDLSYKIGSYQFNNFVNYMSVHSTKYKMLANKKKEIYKTKIIENQISKRNSYYIPKNELVNYEHLIKDGDIIGITTNITGMDMSHVVLAYHQNEELHIIHASLKYGKVMISKETLEEYLMNRKDATGIMIARPL